MARIIEHWPDPSVIEICSGCKEEITLITKYDCDGSPYAACGYCGDCIDNPWRGWKPTPKPQETKPLDQAQTTIDIEGLPK